MKPKIKVIDYVFKSNVINFLIEEDNIMINATEMIKLYPNKLMKDYTILKSTQIFIEALVEELNNEENPPHNNSKIVEMDSLLKNNEENPPHYNEENIENEPKIYTSEDVLFTNKKGGTFMRRELALEFATWLDVKLKLWLIRIIDRIMFNEYNLKIRNIILEIKVTRDRKQLLKYKIDNDQFEKEDAREFSQLEDKLKKLQNEKNKLTNLQTKAIQMVFNYE